MAGTAERCRVLPGPRAPSLWPRPPRPASPAGRIEDDGDRERPKQSVIGSLSGKRRETPRLERGQYLRRDTAADVHAGGGDRPSARLPASAPKASTNMASASCTADTAGRWPLSLIAAGKSADRCRRPSSTAGRAVVLRDLCVKRKRLTRPGPEITRSFSTRPRSRVISATNSSSRGVRAAKSACPPSVG